MDLIIQNASLDEVTAICYRIGEPNFKEMVEANRKMGVVEYLINHGIDLDTAEKTYDKDLQDTEVKVALQNDQFDEKPEASDILLNVAHEVNQQVREEARQAQEAQKAQEVKQNELHLDKAPEKPETPPVNLNENLHQLASMLMESKGSAALSAILQSFGAKSIPELNENHYQEVINKIKEALNG